jgi:hypothetical protein
MVFYACGVYLVGALGSTSRERLILEAPRGGSVIAARLVLVKKVETVHEEKVRGGAARWRQHFSPLGAAPAAACLHLLGSPAVIA